MVNPFDLPPPPEDARAETDRLITFYESQKKSAELQLKYLRDLKQRQQKQVL